MAARFGYTVRFLPVGPEAVAILGSPFETFRQIKTDVQAKAESPVALVVSMADDSHGYAPDDFARVPKNHRPQTWLQP